MNECCYVLLVNGRCKLLARANGRMNSSSSTCTYRPGVTSFPPFFSMTRVLFATYGFQVPWDCDCWKDLSTWQNAGYGEPLHHHGWNKGWPPAKRNMEDSCKSPLLRRALNHPLPALAGILVVLVFVEEDPVAATPWRRNNLVPLLLVPVCDGEQCSLSNLLRGWACSSQSLYYAEVCWHSSYCRDFPGHRLALLLWWCQANPEIWGNLILRHESLNGRTIWFCPEN